MTKIEELKGEIAKLQKQIEQIQSECCHPPSCRSEHKYDAAPDYDNRHDYRVDYRCGLCEKFWTEKQ